MVFTALGGLMAFMGAVLALAFTVAGVMIATVWAVTRWTTCRATPVAAKGAYQTASFAGRGACRTAGVAGRGARKVVRAGSSAIKNKRYVAHRTSPPPAARVRRAEPKRPSLVGPILSVAAVLGGAAWVSWDALVPNHSELAADMPSLSEFAESVNVLRVDGKWYGFDPRVFDLVVEADETPYAARTGLHTVDGPNGRTVAWKQGDLGFSHIAESYDGDVSVWGPLLWSGDEFDVDGDVFTVAREDVPEDAAMLRTGRLRQVARAGKRFASPQEAFEDLLMSVAYDRDLVGSEASESRRAEVAMAALRHSAERLALVKWPLTVEGTELGDVYRLHVALDPLQFREAWERAANQDRGGDPKRLAMLAGLLAFGTICLGVASRGRPA